MKKIGILTFWNVPNYGAFMQAYALQCVLENKYNNCEVKQIPYLNKKHFDVYYSKSIKNRFNHWIINPYFYKALLNNIGVVKSKDDIKRFLDYYNDIKHFNCENGIENLYLDILVLGSDIIWDYSVAFFGEDRYLFGSGINAHKKISYAPGFGTVKDGIDAPEYVKDALKKLDCISVRDNKSAKIVKNICDRSAEVVLDPTLLWDFNNDDSIVKPLESRYIVVYGSFFSNKLIDGAKEYSKKHNLKLICLSSLDDSFDWCDKVINQDELTPFEWCGFFKYADAVMTCTYHGLIFSLIFHKKIIFNMTDFILDKSECLIKELELKEVIIDFDEFRRKIEWEWDYNLIEKKLNKLREKSFKFIGDSINGD